MALDWTTISVQYSIHNTYFLHLVLFTILMTVSVNITLSPNEDKGLRDFYLKIEHRLFLIQRNQKNDEIVTPLALLTQIPILY